MPKPMLPIFRPMDADPLVAMKKLYLSKVQGVPDNRPGYNGRPRRKPYTPAMGGTMWFLGWAITEIDRLRGIHGSKANEGPIYLFDVPALRKPRKPGRVQQGMGTGPESGSAPRRAQRLESFLSEMPET